MRSWTAFCPTSPSPRVVCCPTFSLCFFPRRADRPRRSKRLLLLSLLPRGDTSKMMNWWQGAMAVDHAPSSPKCLALLRAYPPPFVGFYAPPRVTFFWPAATVVARPCLYQRRLASDSSSCLAETLGEIRGTRWLLFQQPENLPENLCRIRLMITSGVKLWVMHGNSEFPRVLVLLVHTCIPENLSCYFGTKIKKKERTMHQPSSQRLSSPTFRSRPPTKLFLFEHVFWQNMPFRRRTKKTETS